MPYFDYYWNLPTGWVLTVARTEKEARYNVIRSLDHTGLTDPMEFQTYFHPVHINRDYSTVIKNLSRRPTQMAI